MCHVVVNQLHETVRVFPADKWLDACKLAWAINGAVKSEGAFDEGRKQ